MKLVRRRRWRRPTGMVFATSLAVCAALTGPALAVPADAQAPVAQADHHVAAPASPAPTILTLITGDRVSVESRAGGKPQVNVLPDRRSGRDVHFSIKTGHGATYVVPSDVASLVPKVLDPELFDITAMVRMGYGDHDRADIPLIVQRAPGVKKMSAPADIVLGTALGSIGGSAAELPKSRSAALGQRLDTLSDRRSPVTARTVGTTLGGIGHIWLDARITATSWDINLTRIGAPQAWDSGHDGAGTTVAVLDTGVDAGHPDLVGQVADSASFTGSAGPDDDNGHGTHVASLLAGTGAASAGARRGVAYKARLLSGKVLNQGGFGLSSWAIAGMQWAVGHHADIVNMSFGAPDYGGDSPMTQAVQSLSASSDTLFVAAAGNEGPGARTIHAPGDAPAALTVGMVGSDDEPDVRSSRGPTSVNYGIKPDITAPGLSIIGAKAGARGDNPYTSLSGTSQATPQVAGGAALLLQEHPGWSAQRIKSALVDSAVPYAGASLYAQGAGRLDIPRALATGVTADRSEVDFGLLKWPHANSVSRAVTLSNSGQAPITLDLTTRIDGAASGGTSGDGVTVSPSRITIPAGGSTSATVSFDAESARSGIFEAVLDADSDGVTQVHLPIGAYVEPERYDVSINVTDHLGRPYAGGRVDLVNGDHGSYGSYENVTLDAHGHATVRVAPGWYSVMSQIDTTEPDGAVESTAYAGDPEVHVTGDTHVTIDARNALPVRAPVLPHVKTRIDKCEITMWRKGADSAGLGTVGIFATAADVRAGRVLVQPTSPVAHGTFWFTMQWRMVPSGHHPAGSPDLYDLVRSYPSIPNPPVFRMTVRDMRNLARIDTTYHALGKHTDTYEERVTYSDRQENAISWFEPLALPSHRIEMVSTDPGTIWYQAVFAPDGQGFRLNQPETVYRPGERRTVHWFRTLHPEMITSIRSPGDASDVQTLTTGLGDGEHAGEFNGTAIDSVRLRLRNTDGNLGETSNTGGGFSVPAGPGTFQAEEDLDLSPSEAIVSAKSHTTWGFSAVPSTDPQRPDSASALLALDYQPRLDALGRASSRHPLRFEFRVTHSAWGPAPQGKSRAVHLWYSSDDGRHWKASPVRHEHGDQYVSVFPAPRTGTTLSVRASAVDTDGNSIDQTVLGMIPVH